MKTEQAIRKLGQTLWDILGREYIDKYCEDKNGNLVSVSSISVEDIAEELVNAGYGKVSEYKAEIERLNSHNGFLQSVISHCKDMLDEAVKQGQIDVLNKIKNCRDATDSDCYPYLERIVNKLIKEVQDE